MPSESALGTGNYERVAEAVVFGAGYSGEEVEEVRRAVKGDNGNGNVAWLRPDMERTAPAVGPGYAEVIVGRVKEALRVLDGSDGVVL